MKSDKRKVNSEELVTFHALSKISSHTNHPPSAKSRPITESSVLLLIGPICT